jgi:hypothetical protein
MIGGATIDGDKEGIQEAIVSKKDRYENLPLLVL